MPTASPAAGKTLLTPTDHTLILIDHQSQMAFATHSIDVAMLRNNVALVAKGAAGFGVSTLLTTVAEKSFSGPLFPEIPEAFPNASVLDRTTMNCWEDAAVIAAVNASGKGRVVLGGRDPHHIAEAEYKAFARSFRQAKALDPLVQGVPSTKGAL